MGDVTGTAPSRQADGRRRLASVSQLAWQPPVADLL